jgi:hypothetical protein
MERVPDGDGLRTGVEFVIIGDIECRKSMLTSNSKQKSRWHRTSSRQTTRKQSA